MNGALRPMAQRILNGREAFLGVLMERGLNQADAEKAMSCMLRLKVAKVDAQLGRISVIHGAYLEADALRRAVDMENAS